MSAEVLTREATQRFEAPSQSHAARELGLANYTQRSTLVVPCGRAATETARQALTDPSALDSSRHAPPPDLFVRVRNTRMMHLLERIAARFNEAGIPLMVLKGAALNLALYRSPDERPMGDLDLLVRPTDCDAAAVLLEQLDCLRGAGLVREDFFPRFHYEIEYTAGTIDPVKIDLHVRPFRPLRYSRLVPDEALWERAEHVRAGCATVLIPSADEMLIHLAAHSAIHGNPRSVWLQDISRWTNGHQSEIDWDRFVLTVKRWGLALPVRRGITRAEHGFGQVCPRDVVRRLSDECAGWRDRLALWQAPRDAAHPAAHVAVNALCTPGWRFVLSYLLAAGLPDRGHMAEWYPYRHRAWLPLAHMLRALSPVTRHFPWLRALHVRVETRPSSIHGTGVFATRAFKAGAVINRFRARVVERNGQYCVRSFTDADGRTMWCELTGKLKFLNHCCRPKAELRSDALVALQPIHRGEEITIDYGEEACDCRRRALRPHRSLTDTKLAHVA